MVIRLFFFSSLLATLAFIVTTKGNVIALDVGSLSVIEPENELLIASEKVTSSTSADEASRHLQGKPANSYTQYCPSGRSNYTVAFTIQPVADVFNEVSYMKFSQQTYNGHQVLWVGSDGPQSSIRAVDLETGEIAKSYMLDILIKSATDWETLSLGPCTSLPNSKQCLFVGDTGNNQAQLCHDQSCSNGRDEVFVYKFEEPDLSQSGDDVVSVTTLALNYHHSGLPTNRADCESMFVDSTGDNSGGKPGDIYLVTKFVVAKSLHLSRLVKVPVEEHENLSVGDTHRFSVLPAGKPYEEKIWTDADMSEDGRLIAIRDYERVFFFPRPPFMSVGEALSSPTCQFVSWTSKSNKEKQFEGVSMIGSLLAEASECEMRAQCEVVVNTRNLVFDKSRFDVHSSFPTSAPTKDDKVLVTVKRRTNAPSTSSSPTKQPTSSPTAHPTSSPSTSPTTQVPTVAPTKFPTFSPTTQAPTVAPTVSSTTLLARTEVPSYRPTESVSERPVMSRINESVMNTNVSLTQQEPSTRAIPLSDFVMELLLSDEPISFDDADEKLLAQLTEHHLSGWYASKLDLPSGSVQVTLSISRASRMLRAASDERSLQSEEIIIRRKFSGFVVFDDSTALDDSLKSLTTSDMDELTSSAFESIGYPMFLVVVVDELPALQDLIEVQVEILDNRENITAGRSSSLIHRAGGVAWNKSLVVGLSILVVGIISFVCFLVVLVRRRNAERTGYFETSGNALQQDLDQIEETAEKFDDKNYTDRSDLSSSRSDREGSIWSFEEMVVTDARASGGRREEESTGLQRDKAADAP